MSRSVSPTSHRELDLHYIPSRYPKGLPSGYPHQFYGKETAEKAVGAADRIFTSVTDRYRNSGKTDVLTKVEEGE